MKFAGYKEIEKSDEYKRILEIYNDEVAKRSKVPLINHIHEGLIIIDIIFCYTKLAGKLPHHFFNIGVVEKLKKAFCLHPIFQNDTTLRYEVFYNYDAASVAYAMEYRHIANYYLSHRKINDINEIKLSPLEEVNFLLLVDKIQNYKDFQLYHSKTHERSIELDEYFKNWFKKLDIELKEVEEIISLVILNKLEE